MDNAEVEGLTIAYHRAGHGPVVALVHGFVGDAASTWSHQIDALAGDTLFQGGPGATGRSFSSFDTIIDSIRGRLLTLPGDTIVHTGHGDSTTIGAELPHLDEWIARGS